MNVLGRGVLLCACVGASWAAQAEGIPTMHRLPAALVLEAVAEAVRACASQGQRVSATVVDIDGIEIATLRGDGSGVHTIGSAHAKALTAVSLAAPILNLETTGQLAELFQQQGFQVPPGMLFRAGGSVIKLGDEVIGAIGVGGSRQAGQCAQAGLDKIRDRLK